MSDAAPDDAAHLDGAAIARLQRIGGVKLASEMIGLFLQHGPERLKAAEVGYASGELRAVELASHSLKSSAGNVGAMVLHDAAQRVESAAEQGAAEELGALLHELEQEYEIVAALLTHKLEELT